MQKHVSGGNAMNDARKVTLYYAPRSAVDWRVDAARGNGSSVRPSRAQSPRRENSGSRRIWPSIPWARCQPWCIGGRSSPSRWPSSIYLSDLFPDAKLAVPAGDPLRGPFLRWMAFYGACLEPACTDKSMKRETPPRAAIGLWRLRHGNRRREGPARKRPVYPGRPHDGCGYPLGHGSGDG